MASVISFTPVGIAARPSSDDIRRRRPAAASSTSSSWWTPIFGWSAEPDYLDSAEESEKRKKQQEQEAASKAKFAPGCFTAEKAKQLRMKTMETESFHDVMYHSAIASRLASDRRSG